MNVATVTTVAFAVNIGSRRGAADSCVRSEPVECSFAKIDAPTIVATTTENIAPLTASIPTGGIHASISCCSAVEAPAKSMP